MTINPRARNVTALTENLAWLSLVINTRIEQYFNQPDKSGTIPDIPPPPTANESLFCSVVNDHQMSIAERLTLLVALAPHLQPDILDIFFIQNKDYDRAYTEFGGVRAPNFNGFIPTGQTVAFLLGPNDLAQRFALQEIFSAGHFFARHDILKLENLSPGEPLLSGRLTISDEYLNLFTVGEKCEPDFSSKFPANAITTNLEWEDLVLDRHTLTGVIEIQDWIKHSSTLLKDWGLDKKIKPGYRTLFYGPAGTGKTLTACLLGKQAGQAVYRLNLSVALANFIGETEKNLSDIFNRAERNNWILFVDEAEALFGNPVQNGGFNDGDTGRGVAYLKQRVADFPGVMIVSANLKSKPNDTFSRYFQSMICFGMPAVAQRTILWKKAFSGKLQCEALLAEKMDEIALKYELTGGAIINVLRYSALMAVKRGDNEIRYKDVVAGIQREVAEEGRAVDLPAG